MKSLTQEATGKIRTKFDTQRFPAKYWATYSPEHEPRIITKSDGTKFTDKTFGFKSRPGKIQQLRQANRALKKSARQSLKRDMSNIIENDL